MSRKEKLLVYLCFLLVLLSFSMFIIVTYGLEDNEYMIVNLEKDFAFTNGSMSLEVETSYDFVNVTIVDPFGQYHIFVNKVNGWNKVIDLTGYEYGLYDIFISCGDVYSKISFMYVDYSSFSDVSFPLSATYKNTEYTIFSNATIKAEINDDILLLDLSWLKEFSKKVGVVKTIKKNSGLVYAKWENVDNGDYAIVTFIKSVEGIKMIYEVNTSETVYYDISIPYAKTVLEGFKKGDIIFDYSDLKSIAVIDSKNGIVRLLLESGYHYLDPVLKSGGFESGDKTPFDGETTSLGGVIDYVTDIVNSGTYSMKNNDTNGWSGGAFVWETFPVDNYYDVNFTGWFYFDDIPDNSSEVFQFLVSRNTVTPFYRDMFRIGVGYNSSLGYSEIVWRYNYTAGTPTYYTGYRVNTGRWYQVEFLSNYTSDVHLFYLDKNLVFNATGIPQNNTICHDHWKFGLVDSSGSADDTFQVYVDDVEINNDPWIFVNDIFIHIQDLFNNPLEDVNVTLYNSTYYELDNGITNSDGLVIFSHTYSSGLYGVVVHGDLVSDYRNVNIVVNTDNNITLKYKDGSIGERERMLIEEMVVGYGFFVWILIQLVLTVILMGNSTTMFIAGMVNLISAIYYTSVVSVASIKMLIVVFLAIVGIMQLIGGWRGT